MRKCFKVSFTILSSLFLFSCDSKILKRNEFEKEFQIHTQNSDSKLFDGDPLHPTYAFVKKGKIIGLEFNANPECGNIISRYFLNNKEEIAKIIIDKDFHSEYCEKTFDSIYVIELSKKKIKIYTNVTDGKEVINNTLIENYNIDINTYKQKIKNWH
jgi:hypothetical protein